MTMQKEYLGDSVYASFDGSRITLTTENGFGPSNTIHLEPGVYRALVQYVQHFEASLQNPVPIPVLVPSNPRLLLEQSLEALIRHQDLTRAIPLNEIVITRLQQYLRENA